MRLLRQLLGRTPSSPSGRVRNYLANQHLGAERAVVHENVINPGMKVPPHAHAIEEVIIVLEGHGECHTSAGIEAYRAGDVIIVPAQERHALHNTGDTPLRQLCIFGGEPHTIFLAREDADTVVEVFNTNEGNSR
jgi:quercetin dioxygenase-like cupin family protein